MLERVINLDEIRDEAWLGDAILGLFVREWLLHSLPKSATLAKRNELFELFVSNQFLSAFGEPTRVEAAIGRLYSAEGLEPAFAYVRENLLPRFLQTARNRKMI